MILFEKHGVGEADFFHHFPLKNYSFPLHFHRAFEIIYVEEGTLCVSIDQKTYLLEKNEMAFVFSNQMHEFKSGEYSEITIIQFSPELIGDFVSQYKGMVTENSILYREAGIDYRRFQSVYGQKSFLYDLCDCLSNEKVFIPVRQLPQTKVLYKMLLYVEENFSQECTLKEAAKYLKYDYPYLSKLFIRQLGIGFTDYLNQYRISRACYLLKNSQMSVGEIAEKCGYDNLRTFHRNFRRVTGMAPGAYRLSD